ncbi:MAG: adenylosuccinate lyase [Patescibacteria group bacterium]|nr:adenylosuccinate lyase [Patescibacteria group bacterium]
MLTNISPLDGRYASKVDPLRQFFSESALIRVRTYVEIEWLIFLCNGVKLKGTRRLTNQEESKLRAIYEKWSDLNAQKVKDIEKKTNHDVKAVEYFIKEHMTGKLAELKEFVHFACTSEDINNLAYALILKKSLFETFIPKTEQLLKKIQDLAIKHKAIPMLGCTHGQSASPTTVGKEFKVFEKRLERQLKKLKTRTFFGKINGATGNYNAHIAAYPEVDWVKVTKGFMQRLDLTPNLHTTQIEPHDYIAEILHNLIRINTIILDLDRDMWLYIGKGYFKQRVIKGEVGSSTMPHKVNPIDFENSEGNLGLANAIANHLAEKLPVSRMQRDLTDSTTLRNLGTAFGYSYLAYESTLKGLSKLEINKKNLEEDLNNNWEVLGEAIQTVMRKHKIEDAYEKLKDLTRGKRLTQEKMIKFIEGLEIPKKDKDNLEKLTPGTYLGLAKKL